MPLLCERMMPILHSWEARRRTRPQRPNFCVSDADRDQAVNELRSEFVDGRLSHETFVYRMQTALDARNRGQLAGLFTDLPPRRARPGRPDQDGPAR